MPRKVNPILGPQYLDFKEGRLLWIVENNVPLISLIVSASSKAMDNFSFHRKTSPTRNMPCVLGNRAPFAIAARFEIGAIAKGARLPNTHGIFLVGDVLRWNEKLSIAFDDAETISDISGTLFSTIHSSLPSLKSRYCGPKIGLTFRGIHSASGVNGPAWCYQHRRGFVICDKEKSITSKHDEQALLSSIIDMLATKGYSRR